MNLTCQPTFSATAQPPKPRRVCPVPPQIPHWLQWTLVLLLAIGWAQNTIEQTATPQAHPIANSNLHPCFPCARVWLNHQPGSWSPSIAQAATLPLALGWRGEYLDPTGFYLLKI